MNENKPDFRLNIELNPMEQALLDSIEELGYQSPEISLYDRNLLVFRWKKELTELTLQFFSDGRIIYALALDGNTVILEPLTNKMIMDPENQFLALLSRF